MFKNAQVGDSVWSLTYEWGVITEIVGTTYPIVVKFNACEKIINRQFTIEGKSLLNHKNPTLFWDSFVCPQKAITPPKTPKYQWLYLDMDNEYRLTVEHYSTAKEAASYLFKHLEIVKPIEETKRRI